MLICSSSQCGREYFPGGDQTDESATNISELSEEKKTGLPTNNLIPERDFSVFDRLSRIAKQRNRKFKATNIRNDMTMLGSTDIHVTPAAKKSVKRLAEREGKWAADQKRLKLENDLKKTKKAEGVNAYQKRVLQNCKTWGGPCTTTAELERALQLCEKEEFCVTQELTYYKLTHPSEFIGNRQMFRVRGISHDEKLDNLRNLLEDEENSQDQRRKAGHIPSNKEVLEQIRGLDSNQDTNDTTNELLTFMNALVADVWFVNGQKKWFVGYVIDVNEGICTIEHLERVGHGNGEWKYPVKEDICEVDATQVVSIKPVYEWDVMRVRDHKLLLKNHIDINEAVNCMEL